ncbi:hypothetical protein AAG570_012662 [Ranatra chinensis]|uniref:Reverse transcriptase/retrotransposon-derived protein RNase H-like domain-containing protein n=1 Tax=Ranatra chinensis TaxID=642074 RepID=A0ABD0YWZ7_9HEMI
MGRESASGHGVVAHSGPYRRGPCFRWLGAVMGGEAILDLEPVSGVEGTVKAHVLDWGPPNYQVILGADALRCVARELGSVAVVACADYVGAAIVRSADAVNPQNVRYKFQMVFYVEGDPIPATGRVMHHIDLDSDCPVHVKPRRYLQAQASVVENKIRFMLEREYQGLQHPGSVDGLSPDQDAPRVCGKYGFLVRVREIRVPPDALWTENGTHDIPMDEFLEGLNPNAIQIYTDDIIVFSRSVEYHGTDLGQLLHRLREFGLRALEEKSTFFLSELRFMVHTVSERGVSTNSDKVRAVSTLLFLKDSKEIKSFQGMVGYYRKFIPNQADRLALWTRRLKKGCKSVVTADMVDEFDRIKEALANAPVLRYPDFTLPFFLTTDASRVAVGAILSQVENEDRPVTYASRKLTDAETRYPTIGRELLGVVWGIHQFRPYLWGRRHFSVKNDHKPPVWVDWLKENSARVTRWKETLAAYNFDIGHTMEGGGGGENVDGGLT